MKSLTVACFVKLNDSKRSDSNFTARDWKISVTESPKELKLKKIKLKKHNAKRASSLKTKNSKKQRTEKNKKPTIKKISNINE